MLPMDFTIRFKYLYWALTSMDVNKGDVVLYKKIGLGSDQPNRLIFENNTQNIEFFSRLEMKFPL